MQWCPRGGSFLLSLVRRGGDWWRKWELSKKPAKTMTYSREATPEGWNSKACAVAQRLKDSIDIDTVGIKENVTSSSH